MSKTYDDLVDEITSGDRDLGAYYSIEEVGRCAWDCQQRKIEKLQAELKQKDERLESLDWQYKELMRRRIEVRKLKSCLTETNQHIIELLEYSEIDKDVAHVWANAEDGMYRARQCLKKLDSKESKE